MFTPIYYHKPTPKIGKYKSKRADRRTNRRINKWMDEKT